MSGPFLANPALESQLHIADFFLMRTPLLPITEFVDWSRSAEGPGDQRETSTDDDVKWEEDLSKLRTSLRQWLGREECLTAIRLASHSLHGAIAAWEREPAGKKGRRTELALARYFQRMTCRATPFGLFAGCSLGCVGGQRTSLSINALADYRAVARLDFEYLFSLTSKLVKGPLRDRLTFYVNASVSAAPGGWSYLESRVGPSGRTNHIVRLEHEVTLARVLTAAASGADIRQLSEVVLAVPENSDLTLADAQAFVSEIVDAGILTPTLSPAVTGDDPLGSLIQELTRLGAIESRDRLLAVNQQLTSLSTAKISELALPLASVTNELADREEVADDHLIQVDLVKPAGDLRISEDVGRLLAGGVVALCRVTDVSESDALSGFRESFGRRYERSWVRLTEAMDDDIGIGFGGSASSAASRLIQGLPIGQSASPSVSLSPFQKTLLAHVVDAARTNSLEIRLGESDLRPAEPVVAMLPASFSLQCSLMKGSKSQSSAYGDVLIRGVSGPSGAKWLGRFCHTMPDLEQKVREYLRTEEAQEPDSIFAEIVYLPEGRLGNVMWRPLLRQTDIVCLGRSGAPQEKQLSPDELMVTVAEDGRILLYSERLRKLVVPRLTSAHGYLNPRLPSTYRFLCALQNQKSRVPYFAWGPLDGLPFLPRVRVGPYILSLAQWTLGGPSLASIQEALTDRAAFTRLQEFRTERNLPRWLMFVEGDNTLPVDLDNGLSVSAFLHVLKRSRQALLREMLPAPTDCVVDGPEGQFAHELIVPFTRKRPVQVPNEAAGNATQERVAVAVTPQDRLKLPWSDWCYVKLYGGPQALDRFLLDSVVPCLADMRESGALISWFFLRYSDPELHLRLRIRTRTEGQTHEVLEVLSPYVDAAIAQKSLRSVTIDSYQREVERFGGLQSMPLVEELFGSDSDAILGMLQALGAEADVSRRPLVALSSIDALLADFGMSVTDKLAFVTACVERLAGPASHKTVSVALDRRYRRERDSIKAVKTLLEDEAGPYSQVVRSLRTRTETNKSAVSRLLALERDGLMQRSMRDIIGSLVHLHVNRFLVDSPNPHELVLYDFLRRQYTSELARARQGSGGTS